MSLDIIIPIYNAKATIRRTLYSIATQRNICDFCVYLINDCSDYDYSDEVSLFSKFYDIKELKMKKNGGPGLARQYGIDNSTGNYIVFIDADDYFYSPFALSQLYNSINKKYDLVISNFLYKRDNQTLVKKNNWIWLHGKIYSRKFLEKNNIRFNNSRENEDNGFNRLIMFYNPKYLILDSLTYEYSENPNSITRKNNREYRLSGLKGFIFNMNWAIEEGIIRKLDKTSIYNTIMSVFASMYYYYLELYNNYDVSKIIEWTSSTKLLYDRNFNRELNEKSMKMYLKIKEDEYKTNNIKIIKHITFLEFLEKIEEFNYDRYNNTSI